MPAEFLVSYSLAKAPVKHGEPAWAIAVVLREPMDQTVWLIVAGMSCHMQRKLGKGARQDALGNPFMMWNYLVSAFTSCRIGRRRTVAMVPRDGSMEHLVVRRQRLHHRDRPCTIAAGCRLWVVAAYKPLRS